MYEEHECLLVGSNNAAAASFHDVVVLLCELLLKTSQPRSMPTAMYTARSWSVCSQHKQAERALPLNLVARSTWGALSQEPLSAPTLGHQHDVEPSAKLHRPQTPEKRTSAINSENRNNQKQGKSATQQCTYPAREKYDALTLTTCGVWKLHMCAAATK